VLFASFKYGCGERGHDGRRFTDLDERGWAAVSAEVPQAATMDIWTTADARPGRAMERWCNLLVARRDVLPQDGF
jgi:hypothetical protein